MSLSLEVIEDLKNEWLRELPSGWRFSRFGDVLEIKRRPIEVQDHVEYLQPVIRRGHGGIEVRERQLGASIKTKAQFLLRAGDWLMSKVQILHRAYGLVPCELDKAIASGSYYAFKIHEDIDPKYLWYLSHANAFHKSCELSSVGVVIEKMVFRATDWLDFEFPLPPLHEQRRIAEILSSVDEAIAATRAVIEQTRKVKQGVLERLLTKGIGHTRFKQTEIGEIPEEWDLAEVQEHFHVQLGKMLSKAAKVGSSPSPYLRNANVQWGRINTEDLLNMDFSEQEKRKFRLQPGDLLVCEGGEVGRCAIWNDGKEMYYQKALHRVRERTGIVRNQFLMYVLLRTFTSKALSAGLVGTNSIAHFTSEQFLRLKFPVPHADEQNTICETLAALDLSTNENASKMDSLLSLKSALMSDLLTGRKRVTDALPMAAE